MVRVPLLGLLLFAAGPLSGCANLPALNPDEASPPAASAPAIAGGYAPANLANPDVAKAERLAVDEIYKREPQRSLVENVVREQQVVAGLNYRFTVKMSGQNSYRIVVFRPLQGEMSVTSFEKLTPLN